MKIYNQINRALRSRRCGGPCYGPGFLSAFVFWGCIMTLKNEQINPAIKNNHDIIEELGLCSNDTIKIRTIAELLLGIDEHYIFVTEDEDKLQALKEIFDDIAFSIEARLKRVEEIFRKQYWEASHE